MRKHNFTVGLSVRWREYWNPRIVGKIIYVGIHNRKPYCKVLFPDEPNVPYWVSVKEIKSVEV